MNKHVIFFVMLATTPLAMHASVTSGNTKLPFSSELERDTSHIISQFLPANLSPTSCVTDPCDKIQKAPFSRAQAAPFLLIQKQSAPIRLPAYLKRVHMIMGQVAPIQK